MREGCPVKKFLLIALLCVSGNVAGGEYGVFKSGNELLSDCTETSRELNYMHCLGYIAAAADTHDVWVTWGDLHRKICTPLEVPQEQLRRVVVKYLEERPALLDTMGSDGIDRRVNAKHHV